MRSIPNVKAEICSTSYVVIPDAGEEQTLASVNRSTEGILVETTSELVYFCTEVFSPISGEPCGLAVTDDPKTENLTVGCVRNSCPLAGRCKSSPAKLAVENTVTLVESRVELAESQDLQRLPYEQLV